MAMRIKKAFGQIIGADFTKAEQKAMDMEIRRQLAEYDEKNTTEIDAIVLWVLMSEYGFGEKRLRQFHDRFAPALRRLVEYYRMDTEDMPWLCTQKLLDKGIDVRAWNLGERSEGDDGSRREEKEWSSG